MLEVQNLKKVYGNEIGYEALKGINLTVRGGEFIGIMGPSGGGRSTLLNLLATIDSPTDGEILLNGKNPDDLNQKQIAKSRRAELGFAFQSLNSMPTLTTEENIILPLTLDGKKVSVMKRQLAELSERLGTNHLLKKRIAEISGGQTQRVAIARAIIHHPQLLLVDEPTGNLDTKSSKDVMGSLQQLNEEEAATILMVTYDPLAASYCKRTVFIKDGELIDEIVQNGNQKEFYDLTTVKLAEIGGVDNEL